MRTYSTISAFTAATSSAKMFIEVAPYLDAEIVAVFEGVSFRAYPTPLITTHRGSLEHIESMDSPLNGRNDHIVLVFIVKDWKGKTHYIVTNCENELTVYTTDGTPVEAVERSRSLLERAREFVFGATSRKPLEGPRVVSR